MKTYVFLMAVFSCVLITGCELETSESETPENSEVSAVTEETSAENNSDTGEERPPVPISTVPVSGQYSPDPVVVMYEFVFSDGAILRFRENHGGDYWGDYPSAGWGEITESNGSKRSVDVNSIVRNGGLSRAQTPVTTPDHDRRMYWYADSEGRSDVKRVDIFEDGWNPLVEGAVLATQGQLGINANLVSCYVTVEQRK